MDKFTLDSNETVILRTNHVSRANKFSNYQDELILTNKAIIYVPKGILSYGKEALKIPFTEIKEMNGEKQVRSGKSKYGRDQLEVYLKNGQEYFEFSSYPIKGESRKWVREINNVYDGNVVSKVSDTYSIDAVTTVAETLRDTTNSVIKVFSQGKKQVCTCPGCGMDVLCEKRTVVKCEYCGRLIQIKKR